ncbi:hypothetical protein D9758_014282 [Tetrapyrgos nigripes]|uniref:GH16 domain-containing protein n=1 Tax=Tetrapyrgos nigripes TaxID=182062 RepID=A0A8H5C430_9AGAR|nr:hypothetical protein D9758_014282 [Tetrapyrgos nigripes]
MDRASECERLSRPRFQIASTTMVVGLSIPSLLALLSLAPAIPVWAATYGCSDSIVGHQFLEKFTVQAIDDLTRGRVKYVDATTAARLNLTYASDDHFIARADYTTVLDPKGPGRNSVRLHSNKQYGKGVMVYNINHLPEGCGTWPAVWSYAEIWPTKGEIDVVEGVNNQAYSQANLHTLPGCNMSEYRLMKGSTVATTCDYTVNYNAGCGVAYSNQHSFGPGFNDLGGGWFAVERTDKFIKTWFWSRDDPTVPWDVKTGADQVFTDTWGIPEANFPDDMCDIRRLFGDHNIIINLTFCKNEVEHVLTHTYLSLLHFSSLPGGEWAGNAYTQSACPANPKYTNSTLACEDYVNNNPEAFENAYFDFSWIKIYAPSSALDLDVNILQAYAT